MAQAFRPASVAQAFRPASVARAFGALRRTAVKAEYELAKLRPALRGGTGIEGPYAIDRQDFLRFIGGQMPSGAAHAHDEIIDALAEHALRYLGEQLGRLVDRPEVLAVPPHVSESTGSLLHRRQHAEAGADEDLLLLQMLAKATRQAKEKRLARGSHRHEALKRRRGIGHGLRDEHQKDAVIVRVVDRGLQPLGFPL